MPLTDFLNAEKEPPPTEHQTVEALREAMSIGAHRTVPTVCRALGLGDRIRTMRGLEATVCGGMRAFEISRRDARYEDVVGAGGDSVEVTFTDVPELERVHRMAWYHYMRAKDAPPVVFVFNGQPVWRGRPNALSRSWTAIRALPSLTINRVKKRDSVPAAEKKGSAPDSELNLARNERAAKRTKTLFHHFRKK